MDGYNTGVRKLTSCTDGDGERQNGRKTGYTSASRLSSITDEPHLRSSGLLLDAKCILSAVSLEADALQLAAEGLSCTVVAETFARLGIAPSPYLLSRAGMNAHPDTRVGFGQSWRPIPRSRRQEAQKHSCRAGEHGAP